MTRFQTLSLVPVSLLLLGVSAPALAQSSKEQQTAHGANPANTTPISRTSPGYVALKSGNFAKAANYFRETHAKMPNDAFAELNLGASYQGQGRMDLAEPLFRRAMTHGHGLIPADVTVAWARSMTVEQIACRNLENGLPAAPAATAKRCQTVLTIAVATPAGKISEEFNTYFEFDSDRLTVDGAENVRRVARQLATDPTAKIVLIGRASKLGAADRNFELSERRAKTVRDAMIGAGVDPSRIETSWTGETSLPVAQIATMREPRNRVVQGKINFAGAIGQK